MMLLLVTSSMSSSAGRISPLHRHSPTMPPKKQPTTEQTPSKSLLTFFDRSPGTVGPSTTKQRASNTSKPVKRRKSDSAVKSNTNGSFGTSTAPLVISDDEDAEQRDTMAITANVQAKEERKEETRPQECVIDISDDDMTGVTAVQRPTAKRSGLESTEKKESSGNDVFTASISEMASIDNAENLVSNGLLQSPPEALREQKIPSTEGDQSIQCRPGIQPGVTLSTTQTSELEQALEEEEGEWNEGDEEGMGMEDLDINDDEEAVLAAMEKPSVDANEQEDPAVGGEKRKRKGKQKASLVEDCNPEIIALDDSDQGDDDDDDSLGGREDVDDFDVDDEECPVCGRTFVGMRGDVSPSAGTHDAAANFLSKQKRSHVTRCPGTDSADIKPKPSKGQQPISSFCKPGQPFTIKSERQKKADAEREREAAEVKNLKGPNAFKVLMSGNKEDEEWKVAEIDLKRDGKRSVGRRKAPFYKVSLVAQRKTVLTVSPGYDRYADSG